MIMQIFLNLVIAMACECCKMLIIKLEEVLYIFLIIFSREIFFALN